MKEDHELEALNHSIRMSNEFCESVNREVAARMRNLTTDRPKWLLVGENVLRKDAITAVTGIEKMEILSPSSPGFWRYTIHCGGPGIISDSEEFSTEESSIDVLVKITQRREALIKELME